MSIGLYMIDQISSTHIV